jgi:chromosome segregation ATPase
MEASMKVTAGETSRLENELTSAQKQLASSQLDNSKLLAEGKELARSLASEKERNNELSQGTRQLKADLAECLGKLQEAKSEGEQLAKDVDKARMSEKRADELERVTKELLIERDTTKRAVEESEAKVQELEEELKEVRASTEARVADLQNEVAASIKASASLKDELASAEAARVSCLRECDRLSQELSQIQRKSGAAITDLLLKGENTRIALVESVPF